MKVIKSWLFFIFLLDSSCAFAQALTPITLSYSLSKTGYKAADTVDFIINAKIKKGWCLYSSEFAADGPIKFECVVEKSNAFFLLGPLLAYNPFAHYDEVWEAEVKIFEEVAQFRLPMVVKKSGKIIFRARIEGQGCNEVCVPLSTTIALDLSTLTYSDYVSASPSVYSHYEKHSK